MAATMSLISSSLILIFFSISSFVHMIHAQQAFLSNKQLDCYVNDSSTWGYLCNGPQTCSSYLIFRSQPPYNSALSIASLLNSTASDIATINNISVAEKIPADTVVIVPTSCSCSGGFYQHDASYTIHNDWDTYFTISNDTYQGLTTCQAMMNQNKYDSYHLGLNMTLLAPLRCACPSKMQSESGVRFLLTYITGWPDDAPSMANMFGIEEESLLVANEISANSVIYPFNLILVPLTREPRKEMFLLPPPTPTPPPQPDQQVLPTSSSLRKSVSKKWVSVGIGIGAVCFFLLALSGAWCLFFKKKHSKSSILIVRKAKGKVVNGINGILNPLTVYKFADLEEATGGFDETNKIESSWVFRGVVGSADKVAIKRIRGDVTVEINLLKKISHSSVIRLIGFCFHQGFSYLVYEFAEKGSLYRWLHREEQHQNSYFLSWKQRVQIAYDVASGLNYLHSYANPPYVHKDLNSRNILLDRNFRAKLANFGLARAMDSYQLTKHVVGTKGYLSPEYLEHGLVTPKLDVYAYGVVLLELLSGREALSPLSDVQDRGNNHYMALSETIKKILQDENILLKFKEFVDPKMQSEYPFDLAISLAKLAMACLETDANRRPTMSDVCLSMSKIYSISMDWEYCEELSSINSVVYGR